MKLAVSALIATQLGMAGCTTAPEANRPTDGTTVVSVAAPPTSSSMTIPVMVEPAPPEAPVDLARCVDRLRDGAALPATSAQDPGFRDYEEALAAERRGQLAEARKGYFKVVSDNPKSAFTPYAYIAFGQIFGKEAATDPWKFEFAKQSYAEALKYPDASANQFSHYELARIHSAMGKDHDALASLLKVMQGPDGSLCGNELRAHARRDLVGVYIKIGQPDKAFAFLRRAVGNDRGAAELVTRIAEDYDRAGKTEDAQRAVMGAFNADVRSARLCALGLTLQDRPATSVSDDLAKAVAGCKGAP